METWTPTTTIEPGSSVALALDFLYTHDEYGFTASDLSQQVSIPEDRVTDVLDHLFDSDLIEKTADDYYYALDDVYVAEFAGSLHDDRELPIDADLAEYPDH